MRNARGYTLMELLIVIAIAAILGAASVGIYVNVQRKSAVNTSADRIQEALRLARERAVAQQDGYDWGVRLEHPTGGTGFYQIFYGSSYSTSTVTETYLLDSPAQYAAPVEGAAATIIFSKRTGAVLTPTSIIIQAGDTSGLVGYWPLNDGLGTTARDASGNGKNGTLVGGMTWASASSCKVNGCLSAPNPSGGDRVDIPNNGTFNFGSGDFTLMGWVKVPQPPQYGCALFGNYPHAGNIGDLVAGVADDRTQIFLHHQNLSSQYDTHYYNFTPYWNQWTHIAWVKTSSTVKLYVNGEQKLSEATAITYNVSLFSNTWYIVGADWCNPQNTSWLVDEHRVYSRALSAGEVSDIYTNAGLQRTISVNQAGLVTQ